MLYNHFFPASIGKGIKGYTFSESVRLFLLPTILLKAVRRKKKHV